jgi:hypothetical protein
MLNRNKKSIYERIKQFEEYSESWI